MWCLLRWVVVERLAVRSHYVMGRLPLSGLSLRMLPWWRLALGRRLALRRLVQRSQSLWPRLAWMPGRLLVISRLGRLSHRLRRRFVVSWRWRALIWLKRFGRLCWRRLLLCD